MSILARLIAAVAHEIITEYRQMDAEPEPCTRPHAAEPPEQGPSLASADTERAAGWDHDKRHPVTAIRTGFGP